MDYKGLILADKVYLKFNKHFIPWRYSKTDYEVVLAENDYLLPEDKKDLAMHNENLASLLSLMRKKGRTASLHPLVSAMAEDVRALLN